MAILFDKTANEVGAYLKDQEIETRTFFYPLHLQPCYDVEKKLNNSKYVFDHGLCMPSYPELTEQQIIYVCDKIKEAIA